MAVVTWNLGGRSPSTTLDCGFLKALAASMDVVVLGCQEVEEVKPRRSEGRRSRHLRSLFRRLFSRKRGFTQVARLASGGIQLLVASKVRCRLVREASVACGVGNVLRNKGAVAAFVEVDGGRLALVTAHLAAHAHRVEDRNSDYRRIQRELRAASPWSRDCAVVFGGDLNYRLQGLSRAEVEIALADGDASDLLDAFDQLNRERFAGRAFPGFVEGRVAFAPTFKYDRRSNTFDSSKKRRVPAWTDRILFTPSPGLALASYDAVADASHSDHRPVVAVFHLAPADLRPASSRSPRKLQVRPRQLPTSLELSASTGS